MALSQRFRYGAYRSGLLTALVWLFFLFEWVTDSNWYRLGIHPRDVDSLPGIVMAPLLHGDWGHLLSNTPPLLSLLFMLYFFYPRVANAALATIYVLTGAAVWALGRGEVWHIGASGVVYGLATYLAWTGLVRRNVKAIAISLVVVFYYGGMLVGIVPGQEGISWESHLLGALVGVFTAYLYQQRIEAEEVKQPPSWELEAPTPEQPFLSADTFDKTKAERRLDGEQDFWRRADHWQHRG